MTSLDRLIRVASFAAVATLPLFIPAEAIATPASAADVASAAPSGTSAAPHVRSDRITLGGVDYYYELHGRGEPLLLLHGGLGNGAMFGPVLTALADTREVILVDLHGHGRTPLGERPFSLTAMGDDMAALVRALGHEQVDVMGFSMGGGVAFRMAAQHPATVRRLVLVSTPYSDDGFYPGIRAQQVTVGADMAPMMEGTPMQRTYDAVAPNPEDFPRLLDAVGDLMRGHYDWSADVARLTMPVMLVYGDGDMFRLEHVVSFYQLLGGGQQDAGWNRETMPKNRLAILPDLTHYEIGASPRLADAVRPFLDGESGATSWSELLDTP